MRSIDNGHTFILPWQIETSLESCAIDTAMRHVAATASLSSLRLGFSLIYVQLLLSTDSKETNLSRELT